MRDSDNVLAHMSLYERIEAGAHAIVGLLHGLAARWTPGRILSHESFPQLGALVLREHECLTIEVADASLAQPRLGSKLDLQRCGDGLGGLECPGQVTRIQVHRHPRLVLPFDEGGGPASLAKAGLCERRRAVAPEAAVDVGLAFAMANESQLRRSCAADSRRHTVMI